MYFGEVFCREAGVPVYANKHRENESRFHHPELTVTLEGTCTHEASLASVMTAPPVGAAALNITAPVTLEPPVTGFAESVSPETV